jgi:mRNA interferase HigB
VQIFNTGTLNEWARAHPSARAGLGAWEAVVEQAAWKTPGELLAGITADLISVRPNSQVPSHLTRVVFDVSGNRFRLAAHVDFRRQKVFLKWFGTHAEYDKIDFETKNFG